MRFVIRLLLLIVLAVVLFLTWGLVLPVTPSRPKSVLLRPGISSRRIAQELRDAGVIRNANAFLIVHYLRLRPLKAGEYLFDRPANALDIYDRLARGDIYFHTVVVPEGFSIFDIAAAIEAAGLGSRDEFLSLARSGAALISDLDPQAHSLEGYLFPDTYHFTRTQSLQDMIVVMLRRFRQEARALNLAGNVHEVVTLASIVEKETAVAAERPTVAGVYNNRLQRNMALDADPTVVYAALIDGRYSGVIHQSDLQANSPYNTYKYAGLPPGPIANPGRGSLEAALHPEVTDYLFFVSDAQGHHRFARTLDEHAKNVEAYRRATAR
jgi:UPF0755 protein